MTVDRDCLHNRDVKLSKAALDLTDVSLLELAVTDVIFLVDNASTRAGDHSRRKRSCKNEARSIRSDHVNEIIGTCDVTTVCAISFAQST